MVLVLSDLEDSSLSPAQSVLLYQRCRLLLACLQYNNHLSQHLQSKFREEFRSAPLLLSRQYSTSQFCFELFCFTAMMYVKRRLFLSPSRYFLKPSCAEEKLPPHYPIGQPTIRLIEELLSLNR